MRRRITTVLATSGDSSPISALSGSKTITVGCTGIDGIGGEYSVLAIKNSETAITASAEMTTKILREGFDMAIPSG